MSDGIRDVEGDYRAAYLEEYESYKRVGRDDEAEAVAKILRDDYDHDPTGKKRAAKKASAPERADQKAPEQAVPEKPAHAEAKSEA